jgi:hypothetical protein
MKVFRPTREQVVKPFCGQLHHVVKGVGSVHEENNVNILGWKPQKTQLGGTKYKRKTLFKISERATF